MEFLVQPWKHQRLAIERARDAPGFGLFFEMGAGKTMTAINMARQQYEKRGLLRTLILGPPIVLHNWKREWAMHSKLPQERVIILHGAGKDRFKTFKQSAWKYTGIITAVDTVKKVVTARSCPPEPQAQVFITNYESLGMDDLFEAIREWAPELVILDECHRLKDRRSKRSKRADLLCNPGTSKNPKPRPIVYGLTGSPILNDAMDIFHQAKLIDGGKAFGKSFMEFRMRYFRDKNAGMDKQRYFPNWVPIPGAFDEISKRLDSFSMRVKKADCLDLPPLIRQTVSVEMTPGQKKSYQEMLKELVTFFQKDGKEHTAMAALAITKSLRLMQIASGYVKTIDGDEVPVAEGEPPKATALREILEDIAGNHKVLVWAVWKENYSQIRKVLDDLKLKYVEVHGEVGDKKKFENVDQFTTDPDTRVLLGHPGSGGIGINLVAASYSVFYSRNFSLEQDQQAEARNHRGGSDIHERITRIDLITKDTIEEKIVEALARKQSLGEDLLREITLSLSREEKQ